MEDYMIVDLYWARSENAIRQTELKYGRMLTSISASLVPTREDAEECVSDTYMVAWDSMPDERPTYLGAFLSKIVRRISISKYRSMRAEKRGGHDILIDELSECIPSQSDVEREYDNEHLSDVLNRFLLSLDEEKRIIFVRRYFYSESISQIANRYGMTEGKVKTVLFRSRNALKKVLTEEGIAL